MASVMTDTTIMVTDATRLGGAERYMTTIVDCSRHVRDIDLVVAVPRAGPLLRRPLEAAGAEVVEIPELRRRPRPAAVGALLRLVRHRAANALLSNLTDQGDNGSALVVSRLVRQVRTAAVLHLWVPDPPAYRLPFYAGLLRLPSTVITPGQGTADDLRRLRISARVIPNGLSVPEALPRLEARAALGLPGEGLVVGGIGRLTEQKGWDLLTRAWPHVLASCPEVLAVIIGDGDERNRLEGDANGVRFVGAKVDAARLLPAFDLLVVPSRFESHALVPMEAALAGVPVVATDIPGVREGTGPGTVLTPTEDSVRLAHAIARVLGNLKEWTALAVKAQTDQLARFDPLTMTRNTLDCLYGR